MKEIISLMLIGGGLLVVALLLLMQAGKRRSWPRGYAAAAALAAATLVGGWAGYRALRKTYHAATSAFRPRTGTEIYKALFGAAPYGCVQVLKYQDQVVPKIDYAIWLHYRNCPIELRRVLARHQFTRERVATAGKLAYVPYGEIISWFNPRIIGDTVLVYEYATANGRNVQTFWTSLDSTDVFCRDIAD